MYLPFYIAATTCGVHSQVFIVVQLEFIAILFNYWQD